MTLDCFPRLLLGASALASSLVLANFEAGPASADGELAVTVVSVDDSAFPEVTVVLGVEASGRPIPTLAADQVTGTDNGVPVVVKSATRVQDAGLPTTVVATLDTSGSMAGANLARAKEALSGLTSRLAPTDRVALISFSDRPSLVVAPTLAKPSVTDAVAGLQASGNTALYGAVAESARVASSAEGGRRLVILLTDGEEYGNVSGIAREASLQQAAASGAIFYVLGLGVGADRGYLAELASRTGGRYLDAPTTADIERGYAAIEEILKGQFVVELHSSAPPTPPERQLAFHVSDGSLAGSAEVFFRSGRQSPAAPPVESPATPTEVAAPISAVVPAGRQDSSGGQPWTWVLISMLVLVAVPLVGFIVVRRRHLSAAAPGFSEASELPLVTPSPVPVDAHRTVAKLVRRGTPPGIEAPELLLIPMEPVTVGWGPDCLLKLPRVDGLAAVHARLWWRDGNVMLHALDGGPTVVNGESARWASLTQADLVGFGPFSYEFSTRDDSA